MTNRALAGEKEAEKTVPEVEAPDAGAKDITQTTGMSTVKVVKTNRGDEATIQAEGFDLAVLDQFKPYREGEKLPRPQVATNKKGQHFVKKPAEPRFYFEGNDFIKVQMGIHGKKTSLFWRFKVGIPVHKKIRAYLRKKGMTGA